MGGWFSDYFSDLNRTWEIEALYNRPAIRPIAKAAADKEVNLAIVFRNPSARPGLQSTKFTGKIEQTRYVGQLEIQPNALAPLRKSRTISFEFFRGNG